MADAKTEQAYADHTLDWRAEATVDGKERVIRNVAIAGQKSSNGYQYTESALQSAVTLYEGKHVYIGNPDTHRPGITPPPRHPRDLAGVVKGPKFINGRVRGDIHVFATEAGNTLLALAEANPPNVGLSQVVAAQRQGNEITRIAEVTCVELVMNPATTSSFAEGTQNAGDPLEQLRKELAERIDKLTQLVEARTGATSTARTTTDTKQTIADDEFVRLIKDR